MGSFRSMFPLSFQRYLPILLGAALGLFVTWPRDLVARSTERELTAVADVRVLASLPGPAPSAVEATSTPASIRRNANAVKLLKAEAARMSAKNAAETWVGATVNGAEGSMLLDSFGAKKSAVASMAEATLSSNQTSDTHCVQRGQARKDGELDFPSKEASLDDCQIRCRCLHGCEFFTFWKDGSCYLQSKDSEPFSAIEGVFGPPSCSASTRLPELPPAVDLPYVKVKSDGFVGPKVYVYKLPSRFRNWGQETCSDWNVDCVFGGPPSRVHGVDIWASSQFHMPLMLYYRFLHSTHLTQNVDEADVFLIPAYNFRPSPDLPCANNSDLFETLFELNPKLKDKAWAAAKAPRHLLMDARGWETCRYMWELSMPFRLAHRINIELNGLMEDGPEGWTYNKPFVWYQFPYPAVYHGPASATPAKLRLDAGIPASSSRYLWAWSGTGRGNAAALRKVLMAECSRCTRCGKVTKISEVTGSPQQSQIKDYEALSAIKLQSIFCPEPPGDSVTRKSLLDSIVLGCIPIIFVHQELDMFEAFVTAEEFAEAVLYVPEAEILGSEGKISLWGTGTFHEMSKTWRRFKKLYPRSASVFDALAPHHTKEQRETRIRELFPKNRSMLDILTSMSEEEIHEKQRALAKISHRFVIGLDDSSEDSVRILLNRIASNDALVAQRNRESTLSF